MAGPAPPTRPPSARLRYLAVVAALAPAEAFAGAWIAPEGGQQIWTVAAGAGEQNVVAETSLYWEKPVAPAAAIVVAPWVEIDPISSREGWRSEATVGVKAALARGRWGAAAIQAGSVWRSEPDAGCGEAGAELRGLAGLSVSRTGFVNLEAAARVQENGCFGQRYEVTAGYRPRENWLGMAQIFVDAPETRPTEVHGQITLVRFGAEGRGVQFGLRARLDGNAQEGAVVLGFWGRPRR